MCIFFFRVFLMVVVMIVVSVFLMIMLFLVVMLVTVMFSPTKSAEADLDPTRNAPGSTRHLEQRIRAAQALRRLGNGRTVRIRRGSVFETDDIEGRNLQLDLDMVLLDRHLKDAVAMFMRPGSALIRRMNTRKTDCHGGSGGKARKSSVHR